MIRIFHLAASENPKPAHGREAPAKDYSDTIIRLASETEVA
jgi:hypothetical protein